MVFLEIEPVEKEQSDKGDAGEVDNDALNTSNSVARMPGVRAALLQMISRGPQKGM